MGAAEAKEIAAMKETHVGDSMVDNFHNNASIELLSRQAQASRGVLSGILARELETLVRGIFFEWHDVLISRRKEDTQLVFTAWSKIKSAPVPNRGGAAQTVAANEASTHLLAREIDEVKRLREELQHAATRSEEDVARESHVAFPSVTSESSMRE